MKLSIRPISIDELGCCNSIDMSYRADWCYRPKVIEEEQLGILLVRQLKRRDEGTIDYDWDWRVDETARQAASLGGVLLAEHSGQAAGVLVLVSKPPVCLVDALFVHFPLRQQGIGSALLQQGVDWAAGRGLTAMQVEVEIANGPAIDFYRRRGFVLCSIDLQKRDSGTDQILQVVTLVKKVA